MPDIFISYSRSDAEFAYRLRDGFAAAGKRVWIDVDTIEPAADWFQRIIDGIDQCDAFVTIMTPAALGSRICAAELAHAVTAGKRIIPVVHIEPVDDAPTELSRHNYVFGRTPEEFEPAVAEVLSAVGSDPEWVSLHTDLLLRARAWSGAGRRRSASLRGAELRTAQTELRRDRPPNQPQASALQREFLVFSESARRRRRQWAGGVAAGLLIALSGLGIWGVRSSSEATRERAVAESRQLAGLSRNLVESDHQLSLLLALHSRSVEPTPESTDALMAATMSSPNLVRHLPDYDGQVRDVVVGGDGAFYAAGADVDADVPGDRASLLDHDVLRWFPGDRDPTVFATTENAVSVLAADPEARFIAAGAFDGTVTVWDVEEGAIETTWQATTHLTPVRALAADPSGTKLVTGDSGGRVVVWDLSTEPPAPDVIVEAGPVVAVEYRPDGSTLLVVHEVERGASTIDLYDAATGEPVATTALENSETPAAAAWSPDGDDIAVAIGGDVALYRAFRPGEPSWWVEQAHSGQPVSDVTFTSDGHRVLTSGGDVTIRSWLTRSGEQVQEVAPWALHRDTVRAIAVDGDGLCASVARDGGMIVWREMRARMPSWADENSSPVELIDLAGGGSAVTATLADGTVTVYDHDADRVVWSAGPPSASPLTAVALSEPPRWLVAGDAAGDVYAWDLNTSAPAARTLLNLGADVIELGVHASAPLVAAAGSDGTVAIWDGSVERALEPRLYVSGDITVVEFDPSGRRLVVAGGPTIRLVTIGPGLAERDFDPGHTLAVQAAAFFPDGDVLVTGDEDGIVLLWDVATDRSASPEPILHDRRVAGIAVSADGTRVAVADASGTISIWQSATAQRLGVPLHMTELGVAPTSIAFDGTRLVAAVSGLAQSWDLDPAALENAACTLVGRDFTDPEREVFGRSGETLCSSGRSGTS